MTPEQQLDLFQAQRAREQAIRQQAVMDRAVQRLRSVKRVQPALRTHDCHASFCHPQNERFFIEKRLLAPPAVDDDVFLCDYGRVHVCNTTQRECVISVDSMTNNTCVLTGRYYGTGPTSQHLGSGSAYGGDDVVDPGADLGGGDDDYGGGGGGDDEQDNRTIFFETGVSILAANVRRLSSRQSKFIGRSEQHAVLAASSAARPVKKVPVSAPPKKERLVFRALCSNHASSARPAAAGPSLQVLRKFVNNDAQQRSDAKAVLQRLLFSPKRKAAGRKAFDACCMVASKAVTAQLRIVRDRRAAGERVPVDYYALFALYVSSVTVSPLMLAAAPDRPHAVNRAVDVAVTLWRSVSTSPAHRDRVLTPFHFQEHVLAVLYAMRTGGLVLHNHQAIPGCDYLHEYLPPLDMLAALGYSKTAVTHGNRVIQSAFRSLLDQERAKEADVMIQ